MKADGLKCLLFSFTLPPQITQADAVRIKCVQFLTVHKVVTQLDVGTGHIPILCIELKKRHYKTRYRKVDFSTTSIGIISFIITTESHLCTKVCINAQLLTTTKPVAVTVIQR